MGGAAGGDGVAIVNGDGGGAPDCAAGVEPPAQVDDPLQRALVLRGHHVMVLAHARRSLGLNRSYDIVLNPRKL